MMAVRAVSKPALFSNFPQHNYLKLLDEDTNTPKQVADFLNLTKEDVASATGVAKSSVRYDERIPAELLTRMREIAITCELVAEYFKGDAKKTALWFQVKNPTLGNLSPRDMIRYGRYQKLLKYIQNALAGNTP